MRPRLSLAALALALALVGGEPARAADGGSGMFDPKSPDAGMARPRPKGPAGAALGPLPSATRTEPPGMPDAEARYPLEPRAGGGFFYQGPQFSAAVSADGTVTFHDRRIAYSASKAAFSFDLSDEFVRGFAHGTLYPNEKANFLAGTFTRRTEMAAREYSARMRAARNDLPRRLDALWADDRYRRRERRRVIFLLWRDASAPEADARPSAAIIERWIRTRLPRGSPDGYGDAELEALSAGDRPDARAFRPYGSPLEMRWPAQ